jgi:hypothetical protein
MNSHSKIFLNSSWKSSGFFNSKNLITPTEDVPCEKLFRSKKKEKNFGRLWSEKKNEKLCHHI